MSTTTESLQFTSLCIWPPNGTLPSFDPECLCALAHLSFSRLNIRTESSIGRLKLLNERLPLLLTEDNKTRLGSGYDEIGKHFSESHINIDEHCTLPMADILALQIYIKSNLIPAVLETFWLDETYRVSMINVYGQPLGGFPLAFLFGKRRREEIRDKITTIYGDPENDENKKLILEKGKKAVDHLSELLGNKPFLFGVKPTSIDALAFGYLASLIHSGASNSNLGRHASSKQNLREFVNRILTVYLGDLPRKSLTNEQSSSSSSSTEDRLKDKVAVVAIGVLTMCAYAYFSGLIRIEISEVE